ncbi:MAG TPA: STAS domain-containing protein [Tepidisphaeraceae bacterium]|nr:STAS domain-containing protein [Tepidisphaeraceae bacterium]
MSQTRFTLAESGAVQIIELHLPQQLDANEFDRLNESLAGVMEGNTHRAWVLDLAGVEYSGSAVLGLLVNFRQQVKQGGGKLVLSGMSPRLMSVFKTCSLDRLFRCAATRDAAVRLAGD